MNAATEEEVIVGRQPTHEELELVTWAEETTRKGLDAVRDGLRQLVTLTTALLAGSAAFLGQLSAPRGWKVAAAVLLLSALALALWGSLPRVALVDVHCPEAIRREREQGTAAKLWCLRGASLFLLLAFAALFVGLLFAP
jgi:hypothetical protein